MLITQIKALHAEANRPGWGAVAADELGFIQEVIARHRPHRFIEIGTASGLSGGFICRFLEECGGAYFLSIDQAERFFGDPAQPVGFQLPQIYQGTEVTAETRGSTTVLELGPEDTGFDMAFVDGNHRHPWPLIDTLMLYPRMRDGGVMIHHDLALYRLPGRETGIGPKYLFDQIPQRRRHSAPADGWNIFWLDMAMPKERLEAAAVAAVQMPWTLDEPLADAQVAQIIGKLRASFTTGVADAFEEAAGRFNASYFGMRPRWGPGRLVLRTALGLRGLVRRR